MQTQVLLNKLFDQQTLTQSESEVLFSRIVQGELDPVQFTAALIAMKMRGETIEEISGAVSALQQYAQPFAIPEYIFADIVGTGGDGADTINISTASAIVAATMGAKIAKHGNRSVSSKSGSSDVLAALGVNINMTAENARQALDQIGICFLFAQQYHLGFKHAMPVRNTLKTRTIFNILGPLINPAKPKHQLLGVYTPQLLKPYAETALALGHQHTIVVHGSGLDEVALHGVTEVAEVRQGKIEYYQLTPADFGLPSHCSEELKGGDASENARMLLDIFQGKGKVAHNHAVAANTALLLRLFGQEDLKHNVENVLVTLNRGQAFACLQQLQRY
ncbi:anthranilate phosphoribosyltransferase [Mergibacter septicus]|uniref:anthranilate phosphoribosyltransferase n=1 Tax=Mergibacter septicus TaxID=221402 RepID=UPI0011796A83|nr:anthranilate phosphoribosyltransferase [Mergibacter septicus]AWX13312.1 anthranilate phosphoribosyltransferase [Mergibacter septicus]